MASLPYFQLYPRDYLADTPHLSMEESGCYLTLLMVAWLRPDCSIPDDDIWICRTLRMHGNKWRSLKPAVMEFWELQGNQWVQARLLKEWRKAAERCEKNRRKRADFKREMSENKDLAPAIGGVYQNQNQIHKERKKKDSSSSDDDGQFNLIWKKWPRKVGKGAAVKAYAKALKRAKHEEIAAGVDRALPALSPDPQFIPHLATWLNQDRWLDEAAAPMAADPEGNQLRQQAKLLATLTPFAKSQAQKMPAGAIPKMVRLGLLPADIAAEYGVK